MKDSLKLQVFEAAKDGTKKPVTDARVVLGRRDLLGGSRYPHDDLLATHAHTAEGFYGGFSGAAEPEEGQWLLVVTKGELSPVVQKLTLRANGEVLVATPGWDEARGLTAQAATVSIVNAGPKVPGDAPKHSTVNVVLLPRTEIVGITGHDDHGNTEYAHMADGRRNLLFKRKKLDAGSVATLFHANLRVVITTVKSATRDARSWVEVDRFAAKPLAADAGKKRPADTLANELSIVDFYQHLHDVGTKHPGTVVEAGIFSHSWTMGPIIWNTSDDSGSVAERDASDTDGRQKDWLPAGKPSQTMTGTVTDGPTLKKFAKMPDAFRRPDGAFRIWGCSHMQNAIREGVIAVSKLKAKTPRDQFFLVSPVTTVKERGFFRAGEENTTLDHVKRLIGEFVSGTKYIRVIETHDLRGAVNYPGAASRVLQTPVFGAPPGMGSLYGSRDGEQTFYIDHEQRPTNADSKDPRGENFALFAWYHREFGAAFVEDDVHYVDYQALRKAPLPDPGFRTQRYAMFFDQDQGALVLRLPSGLEVHQQVTKAADARALYSRPRPFTFEGVAGHLYVIRNHGRAIVVLRGPGNTVLFVRSEPAEAQDGAVFVGEDGTSRWLVSPARRDTFEVNVARPLPSKSATFQGGATFGEPLTTLPPRPDGVIERVPPKYFW